MCPTRIRPLANFLALTIACTIFNSVAANNNSSLVKQAKGRQGYFNDMYCHVCRSDHNRDCLNEVEKGLTDFSRHCTVALVDNFNDELKTDPPKHPLPIYDNTLHNAARMDKEDITWGCYSVISSDKLFALRTCYAYAKRHEENLCHSCTTGDGKHLAMCCACSKAFCNNIPAGCSDLSPPVLLKLLCMNPLILVIFGKLINLL